MALRWPHLAEAFADRPLAIWVVGDADGVLAVKEAAAGGVEGFESTRTELVEDIRILEGVEALDAVVRRIREARQKCELVLLIDPHQTIPTDWMTNWLAGTLKMTSAQCGMFYSRPYRETRFRLL